MISGHRPRNKKELFNLRHASARNVIERIFGVLKQRFRILLLPPAYKLNVQARLPAALSALHNFIKTHEPYDQPLTDGDNTAETNLFGYHDGPNPDSEIIPDQELEQLEGGTMGAKRDAIADAMWMDYQRVLQERGFLDAGGNSEESSNNSDDSEGDDDDDDMFDGDIGDV